MILFTTNLFRGPALRLAVCALLATGASASTETAVPVTLQSLVDEIVANNPELAFYEAEIDATKAGRRAAGGLEKPELVLGLGRKRVTDAASVISEEGRTWSVSVAQTIEWPGRIALRKAIANRQVELAEMGLMKFKTALAARARTLAYGVHAAHERARATGEVAERYRVLRELFLAREPAGITPLLETRVIEAQELTLQKRAAEAQLDVQSALVELNQLRGKPVDTEIHVEVLPLVFAPPPAVEAALNAAVEHDFDHRAARLELEQQGLEVSLARKDRYPSITVSPYVSVEEAGERERTYGLGLSLPLPLGARTGASISLAEARRRQAQASVQISQRKLEREVHAALQRYAVKQAEVSRWVADASARFREAADLADRHYRLGAVPLSTYVELQNAYLDAIDALCQTKLEALEAAGELQLRTGIVIPIKEVRP